MDIEAELEGLKETQGRMAALLREVGAGPGLEAIVARATLRAHRYVTSITHYITGRLRNSHYPRVSREANDVYGIVGTNVAYAPFEHARSGVKSGGPGGGSGGHAFYDRTVEEEGPAIMDQMQRDVSKSVRRAGGD